MKKLFLVGLSFAAFAAGGYLLTHHMDVNKRPISHTTTPQLDNIEALSGTEVEISIPCVPTGYMCSFLRKDATGTYRWINIPNMTKI